MNDKIEHVLAVLDGFRMSDEMTYPAYSVLHDEISMLDDLLETHVMTREEADKYSEQQEKYVESEKAPVYVEYTKEKPWSRKWLTVDMLHSWLNDWETWMLYGKEWRCWTTRPTVEQREATPWN